MLKFYCSSHGCNSLPSSFKTDPRPYFHSEQMILLEIKKNCCQQHSSSFVVETDSNSYLHMLVINCPTCHYSLVNPSKKITNNSNFLNFFRQIQSINNTLIGVFTQILALRLRLSYSRDVLFHDSGVAGRSDSLHTRSYRPFFCPLLLSRLSYHRLADSYRTLILLLGREEQRSSVTEYPLPGFFQPSV